MATTVATTVGPRPSREPLERWQLPAIGTMWRIVQPVFSFDDPLDPPRERVEEVTDVRQAGSLRLWVIELNNGVLNGAGGEYFAASYWLSSVEKGRVMPA